MGEEIKVYGVSLSAYSVRVEIALKMKGVEYEFIEENLQDKSEKLLKYNPVHKKVPVLVHAGKPIAESSVILEYIDETWKGNPLLPSDPYQRAQARFWANFIHHKLIPGIRSAIMNEGGEESEKAVEEAHELLKVLEEHLNTKKPIIMGGKVNEIGHFDIVVLLVVYWAPIVQEAAGKELLSKDKYPAIYSWADAILACSLIKLNLPNKEKILAYFRARFSAPRVSV